MRDLGSMGESTFSLWCADAELVANVSQIDKTGWDFFVEFPFKDKNDPYGVHNSALECKVQVKATDQNYKKLSIKLSNLRRLATAQMPAFFVFFEFDGKSEPQSAYVVHVDNELISKVLKRLHEVEQSDQENKFNKRKMTVHYCEANRLEVLNGKSLKKKIVEYVGSSMSEYVASKKKHLSSSGFEDGFAKMTLTAIGEENLEKLIDVSIGAEDFVEVSSIQAVKTRFGVESSSPFLDTPMGRLEMPNLKPFAEGVIKFKESKFSTSLGFDCRL